MARTPVSGHGTDSGYSRHSKRGEAPCEECKAAHAAAQAVYRSRPGPAQRQAARVAARRAAVAALITNHQGEFDALLAAEYDAAGLTQRGRR